MGNEDRTVPGPGRPGARTERLRGNLGLFAVLVGLMVPGSAIGQVSETGVPPAERARPEIVSIAEALADEDGDTIPDHLGETVRVRGVVTVPSGLLSDSYHLIYLQDDSGGIAYYSEELGTKVAAGDRVEVRGEIGQYRGAPQIKGGGVELLGRGEIPGPLGLSLHEAASWDHFGELVEVEGTLGDIERQGYIVATLRDPSDSGASLGLFLPARISETVDSGVLEERARLSVTGILTIHSYAPPHRDFQLVLRSSEDLAVLGAPPPPWLRPLLWSVVLLSVLGVLAYAVGRRLWRRRVRKRRRKVEVMGRLSAAIVPPPGDEGELVRKTSKILQEESILDAAIVHLVNPDRRVHLEASYGLPPELSSGVQRGGSDEPLDTEALERRKLGPPDRDEVPESISDLEEHGLQMVASLPLHGRERTLGLLTVFRRTGDPPSGEDLAILSSAVNILASGIESIEMARRTEEQARLLEELSITDELTGLYNRRFLDEYLRIQMAMARREGNPVAFIVIDLDYFKEINDSFGHPVGDRVLGLVGTLIRESVRASDLPVRLGGEEFLVVMPNTGAAGACTFGDRLREEIAALELGLGNDNGEPWDLTASVGVALYPDHGDDVEEVLESCDRALYVAKRGGRNQLELSGAR